jgi:hypothetical protein
MQEVPFQHAAPGELFRARHLADAGAVLQVGIDDLVHGAAPERAAQVPGILVQQAVGHEHYPTAALVLKPKAQPAKAAGA